MSKLGEWTTRYRSLFDVTPPESFTYRSYFRFLLRTFPVYGIGPIILIAYQFLAHGIGLGLFMIGFLVTGVALSVVGFALTRRDYLYGFLAAVPAGGFFGLSAAWLRGEPDAWLLLFAGWFGVIAMLAGVVAGRR